MIGTRGMRQRFLQERQVAKPINEDVLDLGQMPGLVPDESLGSRLAAPTRRLKELRC